MIGQTGEVLSHNMYAYCKNNPILYVDPSGNIGILGRAAIGAVAGGIICGIGQIITNKINGKEWNEGVLGAAAKRAVDGALLASGASLLYSALVSGGVETVVDSLENYDEIKNNTFTENVKNAIVDWGVNTTDNYAIGIFAERAMKPIFKVVNKVIPKKLKYIDQVGYIDLNNNIRKGVEKAGEEFISKFSDFTYNAFKYAING